MKLLVIGQSVIDEIDSPEGKFMKPGGIFYTVTALSQFINEDDSVHLISSLDEKSKELFLPSFGKIDNRYVSIVGEIPKVLLKILPGKEREEKYVNLSQPLNIPADLILSNYNGILINMITGYELNLKQLSELRRNYEGLIYLDLHSLVKDFDENLNLNVSNFPDGEKWLKNVDILQANEAELSTIIPGGSEMKIAEYAIKLGVKILILTKAEKGVQVYYFEDDEINSILRPAINIKAVNKVGCGDIFGAVFFYSYISSRNIIHSIDTANTAAGISTGYLTVEEFENLKFDTENFDD